MPKNSYIDILVRYRIQNKAFYPPCRITHFLSCFTKCTHARSTYFTTSSHLLLFWLTFRVSKHHFLLSLP